VTSAGCWAFVAHSCVRLRAWSPARTGRLASLVVSDQMLTRTLRAVSPPVLSVWWCGHSAVHLGEIRRKRVFGAKRTTVWARWLAMSRCGWARGRAVSTGRTIAARRPPGVLCSGWMWARSGSVCQFRVCSCVLGCYTRSVGNAPLLIGCSAPDRVHGSVTGAALPLGCCFWWCGCMGRGRLWALSCL
jgi:hypothetical protein